jgi:type IV pilus assembly protein PilX
MKKNSSQRQTGVTLPVVLMFLLILTVAASFGIRRSTLAEGISRNQLDYEVSKQAAEAALRDGERDIFLNAGTQPGAICTRAAGLRPIILKNTQGGTNVKPMNYTDKCLTGQCGFSVSYYASSNYQAGVNPEPWWPTDKGGLWNSGRVVNAGTCGTFEGGVPLGTFTGAPAVRGVALQPEYLIEEVGRSNAETIFRITARGFGADVRTETVVQSYVQKVGPK